MYRKISYVLQYIALIGLTLFSTSPQAAVITGDITGTTLTLNGDGGDNTLQIQFSGLGYVLATVAGDTISITDNEGNAFIPVNNAQGVQIQIADADLDLIVFNGGAGKDTINTVSSIDPIEAHGDNGADTFNLIGIVEVDAFGGDGRDTFVLGINPVTGSIAGDGNEDTLIVGAGGSVIELDGVALGGGARGTVSGLSLSFSTMEEFQANGANSTFIGFDDLSLAEWILDGTPTFEVTRNGNPWVFDISGFDVLKGNTAGVDRFNVSANTTVDIVLGKTGQTVAIESGATLTGTVSCDDSHDGALALGSDNEVVELTGVTAPGFDGTATSITGGFSCISEILSGGANSTLMSLDSVIDAEWQLDSTPTYTDTLSGEILAFDFFATLEGQSPVEKFFIEADTTADIVLGGNGSQVSLPGPGRLTGGVTCSKDITDGLLAVGYVNALVNLSSEDSAGFTGTVSKIADSPFITDGFSCISDFDATEALAQFTGLDNNADWDISDQEWRTYSVQGGGEANFRGFDTVNGGNLNDVFAVSGDTTLDIFGREGDDTIHILNQVTLTGTASGGTTGTDTLIIETTNRHVKLDGSDSSGFNGEVSNAANTTKVITGGFQQITRINATGKNSTLTGQDVASTWTMDSNPRYETGGNALEFSGFYALFGHSGTVDTYILKPPFAAGTDERILAFSPGAVGSVLEIDYSDGGTLDNEVILRGAATNLDTTLTIKGGARETLDFQFFEQTNDWFVDGKVAGKLQATGDALVSFELLFNSPVHLTDTAVQHLVLDFDSEFLNGAANLRDANIMIDDNDAADGLKVTLDNGKYFTMDTLFTADTEPTGSVTVRSQSAGTGNVHLDSLSVGQDFDADLIIENGGSQPIIQNRNHSLNLAAGRDLKLQGGLIVLSEPTTSDGGNLVFEADVIDINAAIDPDGGNVTFRPYTDGLPMSLGGVKSTCSPAQTQWHAENRTGTDTSTTQSAVTCAAGTGTELTIFNSEFTNLGSIGNVTYGSSTTGDITLNTQMDIPHPANRISLITNGDSAVKDTIDGAPDLQANEVFISSTLSPGVSAGVLWASADLIVPTGASFLFEIGGTSAGTEYDQLKVTGAVNFGDFVFGDIVFIDGFVPEINDTFIIIDNDAVDPFLGLINFANEGSTLTSSGVEMTLSYAGGDGNDVSLTVTSVPTADLSISIDDGVTTAVPGEVISYTIVASNNGPDAAGGVPVDSTFPIGPCDWTAVSSDGATGETVGNGPALQESIDLPSGASMTYTVACTIPSSATGTLSTTATIGGDGGLFDSDTNNNSATDNDTLLQPSADLSVSVDDGITNGTPGETLTYTLVVANAGPSDDPAAELTDVFPVELDCAWTSQANNGAGGNSDGAGTSLNQALSLPAGSDVSYEVVCNIDPAASGPISNSAGVDASFDDIPSDNSDTDNDTNLNPVGELAITIDNGVDEVSQGEQVSWTITVTNDGPSHALGVAVDHNLPVQLTGATWSCATTGDESNCNANGSGGIDESVDIGAAGQVVFTLTATIEDEAAGDVVATATLVPPAGRVDGAPNNSATDTDPVKSNEDVIFASGFEDTGVVGQQP